MDWLPVVNLNVYFFGVAGVAASPFELLMSSHQIGHATSAVSEGRDRSATKFPKAVSTPSHLCSVMKLMSAGQCS